MTIINVNTTHVSSKDIPKAFSCHVGRAAKSRNFQRRNTGASRNIQSGFNRMNAETTTAALDIMPMAALKERSKVLTATNAVIAYPTSSKSHSRCRSNHLGTDD